MRNDITMRLEADLSITKPPSLSPYIFSDQLCYSALSEWIRTICCDVDPAMGNNRLGVTRAYLEARGSNVLDLLSKGLFGKEFPAAKIKKQVSWMVDAMIEIAELWVPDEGIVSCRMTGITNAWRGHGRLLGQSSSIPVPYKQIGLCRYTKQHLDQKTLQNMAAYQEEAKTLMTKYQVNYEHLISMDEMEDEVEDMATLSRSVMFIPVDITTCSKKLGDFILMASWPLNLSPLSWDQTKRWMMPELH